MDEWTAAAPLPAHRSGMSNFETLHPRGLMGKFTEKPQSEAETSLFVPKSTEFNPVGAKQLYNSVDGVLYDDDELFDVFCDEENNSSWEEIWNVADDDSPTDFQEWAEDHPGVVRDGYELWKSQALWNGTLQSVDESNPDDLVTPSGYGTRLNAIPDIPENHAVRLELIRQSIQADLQDQRVEPGSVLTAFQDPNGGFRLGLIDEPNADPYPAFTVISAADSVSANDLATNEDLAALGFMFSRVNEPSNTPIFEFTWGTPALGN